MRPIDWLAPQPSCWNTLSVDVGLGAPLVLDAFLCRGISPKPLAVVTAGVHGDEYEGPAAISQLSTKLQPEKMRGSLIAIPVANPMAFSAAERLSPSDGRNLNRTFPGNSTGSPTERLAAWLFDNLVQEADYLIDLHSGGVAYRVGPLAGFYGQPVPGNPSFDAARLFGLAFLWQLPETAGVLSHEAWKRGVVSIGTECLGAGQLSAEGTSSYVSGILSCLALWGICPEGRVFPDAGTVLVGDWDPASTTGLFRVYCQLGDKCAPGQLLAEVFDVRGRVLQQFVCVSSGIVLGLRSKAWIQEGDWGVLVGVPIEGPF